MAILVDFNPSFLFIAIGLGLLFGLILTKRGTVDKSKYQGLEVKEFCELMRKGTLIDIRGSKQYSQDDKIVGAKNYANASGATSGLIRKDIPVYIYDQNGSRSQGVAKTYVRKGYVMVYFLKGGLNAYKEYKRR